MDLTRQWRIPLRYLRYIKTNQLNLDEDGERKLAEYEMSLSRYVPCGTCKDDALLTASGLVQLAGNQSGTPRSTFGGAPRTREDAEDSLCVQCRAALGEALTAASFGVLKVHSLFRTTYLQLFMPSLPHRAGRTSASYQKYALSRCTLAARELGAMAEILSRSIVPSHFLFDFNQHLTASAALLLLLAKRALRESVTFEMTMVDVDACMKGLEHIARVYAGGKAALVSTFLLPMLLQRSPDF